VAKPKKPASSRKPSTPAPKAAVVNKTTPAPKAAPIQDAPSKATQAASAKTEQTAVAAPADKPKVEPAKAQTAKDTSVTAKSEAKPAAAEPKTVPADAKPVVADKPAVTDTPEQKAPAAAKPEVKATTPPPSTPTAKPVSPPPPAKSGNAVLPLVLGGVIAAGLGFAASQMSMTGSDTTDLEQAVARQKGQIEELQNATSAAPQSPDLSGIQDSLASLTETVSLFEDRLAEIESRPAATAGSTAPQPDYRDELTALQASVQEQKDEIARLLDNALSVEQATANAARQAALQGSLTQITAALNTGAGYEDAVAQLAANDVADLPEALTANAAEGVPNLLSLQTDFADAARAALTAARAAGTDGGDAGVGAFLRRQLGARSVAPREGSDPDAVLSRAEAAVREGRIADALTEIDTLPPEAQAAMDGWLTKARTRAQAEAAVQDLSQSLTAN